MKELKKSILVYCTLFLTVVLVFENSHLLSYNSGNQLCLTEPCLETTNEEIDILLLMDDKYGGNYEGIIAKFQQFGWNITIAGPTPTVNGCVYLSGQSLDVDILISDITDVTQFDCVNIMPGSSHDYLRTNSAAQNLIKTAVANDLIVSAWCRGVRVLATADVLDGKNITGHIDYKSEYETAGATFFEGSAPIIDGNIVTGVRSRFYQLDMCIAIAKALGVHESDAPTIEELFINPLGSNSYNLTLIPADASGILTLKVTLNPFNIPEDISASKISLSLYDTNTDGIFNKTLTNLLPINYSVDVTLTDIFFNDVTYEGYFSINNLDIGKGSLVIPVVALIILGGVVLQVKRRKTTNN